jgi:hypothetical protein
LEAFIHPMLAEAIELGPVVSRFPITSQIKTAQRKGASNTHGSRIQYMY